MNILELYFVKELARLIHEYYREYSFLEQYKQIVQGYNPHAFIGQNNMLKIFSFYYWNIILSNEYRVHWNTQFKVSFKHIDHNDKFIRLLKFEYIRKKRKWEIYYT
jgi:hypothetical protein